MNVLESLAIELYKEIKGFDIIINPKLYIDLKLFVSRLLMPNSPDSILCTHSTKNPMSKFWVKSDTILLPILWIPDRILEIIDKKSNLMLYGLAVPVT